MDIEQTIFATNSLYLSQQNLNYISTHPTLTRKKGRPSSSCLFVRLHLCQISEIGSRGYFSVIIIPW